MKILKIFGVVVGIHVFALILIFANPGCSSAKRPTRDVSETVIAGGEPTAPGSMAATSDSPLQAAPSFTPAPGSFDPNAPATVRFSPTRPGTPTAAALEAAPVADVTPASTYTVVKGDSLWTIAKRHHSSVAEIAAANNLRTSATVRVGQKLIIPAKAVAGSSQQITSPESTAPAPAIAAPRSRSESIKHVVRPGETLGAIARKYQVRVGDIATANSIADPARIRPGMELTIPGWQAPSSRAAQTTTRPAATEPAQPPATTPAEPAPASVPTLIIGGPEEPAPEAANPSGEAPVIQVEEK